MATKKKKKVSPPKSSKKAKSKTAKSKLVVKKKAAKKRSGSKPKSNTARPRPRGRADAGELMPYEKRGLGARSGGQSGDTQGIAAGVDVDSESVEELLEEGQAFEAEVVDGVENAPDPDQGELRTREVDEDDVPEEYRDRDQ